MLYFFLEIHTENQTNVGNQNTQQNGQNPVNQPVQIPKKPKANFWMMSTVLLLIILLIGGAGFVLNTKNRISSDQQPATSNQANETVVTGVLRTSGLSEEEKQKFGLTTVNYQITDFGDYQKAYQEGQVMGYYLISNTVNDELLGKCIRVAGTVPQEWKNKNKSDSYNRLALNITNIEKIDDSTCNPYSQTPPTVDNTQEKVVLRGTVVHGKRPSPDIGYDYQLTLAEPFTDKLNATGQGPQPQNTVDIVPPDNDIWTKLEENINKEINVEGDMVWGYAESRYLQISAIKSQASNTDLRESRTYKTNNFTLKYPLNWKVSTKQIEYYDSPTLELTKVGGKKMWGGYELPQLWIGSFEIFSTSGAICANEPYCEKVDKISFTIKGKNYSTDVFKRQIWNSSGKFTGNYFYVFQAVLDSAPSRPTVTGIYDTTTEKLEIENILSSINY